MFSRKKFELIVPVFFGCLGSLFLCASLTAVQADYVRSQSEGDILHELADANSAKSGNVHFFTQLALERSDLILELYRDPKARGRVVDFFADVCASPEIVEVILANVDLFDIPPALAFALAWEESRLDPRAVNSRNRNGSIDRGLFQLNNRSFPQLEIRSFFDPAVNAWYAMNHFRFCLDAAEGYEVAALAMYNAGTTRVNSSSTPKTTLDYASRILANRREIEHRFMEQEFLFQERLGEMGEAIADAKSERSLLVPLMPLSGRK